MIKILCVGKIKEEYWKHAIFEYQKRLSRYTKLHIIEVLDISGDHIPTILEKEKEQLNKHIHKHDYVITMEIEGTMLSSTQFLEKIETIYGMTSNIVFVIGGSYGLHDEIKKRSNYSLSFSKLTFPHQLFRILLLEQIYRIYKIKNNESYHK